MIASLLMIFFYFLTIFQYFPLFFLYCTRFCKIYIIFQVKQVCIFLNHEWSLWSRYHYRWTLSYCLQVSFASSIAPSTPWYFMFIIYWIILLYNEYCSCFETYIKYLRKLQRTYHHKDIPIIGWTSLLIKQIIDCQTILVTPPFLLCYDRSKSTFLKLSWIDRLHLNTIW